MLLILWILLGFVLGLITSKIVVTTGEGTVVDILLGIVGEDAVGLVPRSGTFCVMCSPLESAATSSSSLPR